MKKLLMTLLAVATAVPMVMAQAPAAEPPAVKEETGLPVSFELSLDFMSDYVWRGQTLSDRPVWQPGATLSYDAGDYGSLSANVWASFFATHRGEPRTFAGLHEVDYTVSYAKSFGDFAFELGHIWYTFPHQRKDGLHSTQELYLSVAYENDIVTPSITAYWDYTDSANIDASAMYYQFALGKDIELTDRLSLGLSTALGLANGAYMSSYAGHNEAEFVDFTAGLSLTYALTDYLSVGGSLNYLYLVSEEVRESGYSLADNNQLLFGGVNVTLAF